MPDIFYEVAEDLRAERTRKFLLRYAGVFAAALAMVLLGIGGWKAWQWHQHQQNLHVASRYITLTDRIEQQASGQTKPGEIKDAKALLAFARTAPAGYANLARLRAAALYAKAGDIKTAGTVWSQVSASNSGATPLVRDLATLLHAQNEMGVVPSATVQTALESLTRTSNPWHALAQFDIAVLDIEAGKTHKAKALLDQVSADPAAPSNLRNLAQGLIAKLNG